MESLSVWTLTAWHYTQAAMTQDKVSDPSGKAKGGSQQGAALDRRKAALKANMARRKDQARARAAQADPIAEGGQDETGHDPMGE